MARMAGLEPATLGFEARYSIQLSYRRTDGKPDFIGRPRIYWTQDVCNLWGANSYSTPNRHRSGALTGLSPQLPNRAAVHSRVRTAPWLYPVVGRTQQVGGEPA